MEQTYEQLNLFSCQKQTAGASVSHVRTSALQENNWGSTEIDRVCSLKSCDYCKKLKKKINPNTCSLKMLKTYFQSIKGGTSSISSIAWMRGGYDAEWQLLNSKDFGVPQNRERVFIIGHLRGRCTKKVFHIRQDSFKTNIKVIGTTKSSTAKGTNCRSWVHATDGIIGSLTSTDYKQPKQIMIRPVLTPTRLNKRQNGRRFKEAGEPMFTLTKQDVHGVMITEATKKGYSEANKGDSINLAAPGSKTRRGRVGKGIANTLDTSCNQGTLVQDKIRRLTPKECWRLQGIPDEITDKVIQAGISDTQMYRGAGDATTVNVIYAIAKRM